MAWKSRLRRPLHLTDNRTLRTLDDARSFVLRLPDRDGRHDKWQRVGALLLSAAQSDNASLVSIVTDRLADALRLPPFTVASSDMIRRNARCTSAGPREHRCGFRANQLVGVQPFPTAYRAD